MIRIGVKEWFRKKFSIKQHEGKNSLQILETNDQIKKFHLEQEVVKNLGHLEQTYFAETGKSNVLFTPEEVISRLNQNSQYADRLGEDFSKVAPEEFRNKMKEYCRGTLSLAEYEYYWIAIEKEAIKKIGNKEIIEALEQTLTIRERIFQMCMANEIANPLLNEKAFDEVIGRIAYRHYQIDTAILRDEKNVVKFANKHETAEKWETCSEGILDGRPTMTTSNSQPVSKSTAILNKDKTTINFANIHETIKKWEAYSENVQGVSPLDETSQPLPPIVTARLKNKIPQNDLKEIHKKDAGESQEKKIIQLIQNKAKNETKVRQKNIQKARKWYVFSR